MNDHDCGQRTKLLMPELTACADAAEAVESSLEALELLPPGANSVRMVHEATLARRLCVYRRAVCALQARTGALIVDDHRHALRASEAAQAAKEQERLLDHAGTRRRAPPGDPGVHQGGQAASAKKKAWQLRKVTEFEMRKMERLA